MDANVPMPAAKMLLRVERVLLAVALLLLLFFDDLLFVVFRNED